MSLLKFKLAASFQLVLPTVAVAVAVVADVVSMEVVVHAGGTPCCCCS